MTTTRWTASALRAGVAAVAAAPLALAVSAAPAHATDWRVARTGAGSAASTAVDVTGTDCPDTPSPSFCLYSWASGSGRFSPTGFETRDGTLVVAGIFSGTASARHQDVAVAGTPATVPVGRVTVGRDAVVVTPATATFGPYVEGGSAVTTTSVELPELAYPAPGAVFASVGAITLRTNAPTAAHTARDWRRAGSDITAQAVVLDLLLAR